MSATTQSTVVEEVELKLSGAEGLRSGRAGSWLLLVEIILDCSQMPSKNSTEVNSYLLLLFQHIENILI